MSDSKIDIVNFLMAHENEWFNTFQLSDALNIKRVTVQKRLEVICKWNPYIRTKFETELRPPTDKAIANLHSRKTKVKYYRYRVDE